MSVRITTWIWENSPASGMELLILLALADQSDDDGLSWPSIAYIARKTRLHEDTVNRNLRSLIDRGEVSREERPGRSNLLRIVRTPPQATGGFSSGGFSSGGSSAPPTPPQAAPPPPRNGPPQNHQEPSEEPSLTGSGALDLQGVPTPATSKAKPKRGRAAVAATPAPESMDVPPALVAWARSRGITADVAEATEEFLDWHRARGNTFKDWEAARRTWLNNTKRFGGPQSAASPFVTRGSAAIDPALAEDMRRNPHKYR
jgi:hypothetical protein